MIKRTGISSMGAVLALAVAVIVAQGTPAVAAPSTPYATPELSCGSSSLTSIEVTICAPDDGRGAPAGISLHWMTLEDYEANGGWGSSEDGTLCAASFSGQPSLNPGSAESRFSLAPGTCVTVEIGDLFDETGASWSCDEELLCGTTYVFRAFSHASNRPAPGGKRSAFSDNLICSTLECGPQGCVFTQGYWKTHGLDLCQAGQNGNEWPASATPMLLGGVSYTADQLCAILKTPAKGNGLIFLAHQLITAKLNTANGASSVGILGLIAQADALINGLVVPPIGAGFLAPADASQLNAALGCWNTHGDGSDPEVPSTCPLVGPPHCEGIANPGLTSDKQEEPVTWGYVKSLLR